jgi:hypothetical protein
MAGQLTYTNCINTYVNPVLAPTVYPGYSVDAYPYPTSGIQAGTLLNPDHYNRQPTAWAHPSSQACAAVYLAHDESWPRISPSGAGLRRLHRPVKVTAKKGHCAAGAYQAGFETPGSRLPIWRSPVGLPPSIAHLPRYNIHPIQPFITPQCLPHQF